MNNSKKRIYYLDIVRGICIIYMILGHIGFQNKYFDHYIHAFHMPMFFLISGILFNNNAKLGIFAYIKKMLKKVIVPYFIWAFIFLIIDNKTSLGRFFGIRNGLRCIFTNNNVYLPIGGALWFLTSFFFCNIIFYILRKNIRDNKIFGIVISIAMIIGISLSKYFDINLWWSLNSSLVGLGIYYIGYLIKSKNILEKLYINNIVIIIIMFIFNSFLIISTSYVNMRTGIYPNMIIFLFNVFLSFVVYANIARKMENTLYLKWLNDNIVILGNDSIIPLCLNQFLIICFSKLYSFLNFNYLILQSLISISVILLLILIIKISKKTKLMILFGR